MNRPERNFLALRCFVWVEPGAQSPGPPWDFSLWGLTAGRANEPAIKAAKTIKQHWAGVLRWFTWRISNGVLEAINSLIQSAKAKARGFRNRRYCQKLLMASIRRRPV